MKDESTIKVACTIGLSEIVDDQQNTILLSACLKNNYNLVESLINNKCNKTAINKNKDNAVLCTSISGSTKIFDFLIKNGLDANYINENSGKNALLIRCECGNLDLIKHLVSRDPKKETLSFQDKGKQNCVLLAVSSGRWEIVEYLIHEGADYSIQSSNNDLPVLRSIRLGYLKIFKKLLKYNHNIDLNGQDDFLSIAISNQKIDIIKYILSNCLIPIKDKHKKLCQQYLCSDDSADTVEVRNLIDPSLSFIPRSSKSQNNTSSTNEISSHQNSSSSDNINLPNVTQSISSASIISSQAQSQTSDTKQSKSSMVDKKQSKQSIANTKQSKSSTVDKKQSNSSTVDTEQSNSSIFSKILICGAALLTVGIGKIFLG